jgi:hypothetical protein
LNPRPKALLPGFYMFILPILKNLGHRHAGWRALRYPIPEISHCRPGPSCNGSLLNDAQYRPQAVPSERAA